MEKSAKSRMFEDAASCEVLKTASKLALDYMGSAFERHVYPRPDDLERLAKFSEPFPERGEDAVAIVRELHDYGSPATVATTGGRYFGLVVGGSIPAAMGARWLADVWDQNCALYKMSPVVAKIENVCEQWLKEIFNLPEQTVAGFVSGTSNATFCGLAAARYELLRRQGWDVNASGLAGAPRLRMVMSRQAHGSVVKAAALLGFGTDNIERVDVDDQGRMMPACLPKLDDRTVLVLQAGNVDSGSFDPFEELCAAGREAGAWIHIDGAFGLWAEASTHLSVLTRGMQLADSWSVDGHKTLNTPFDCGVVLCRDRVALATALQMSGSYIVYSENRDGMLYTQDMSRRARAIEMWASLKYLGKAGLSELVEELHERAVQMGDELHANGFEVLNEVVFNQALVACENDPVTERTIENIQESGECWVGGSRWRGRSVIRISVCSWATTPDDVTRSAKAFVAARKLARQQLQHHEGKSEPVKASA